MGGRSLEMDTEHLHLHETSMAGLHGDVQPSHDFGAAPQGAAWPRDNGYFTTLVTRLVPSV